MNHHRYMHQSMILENRFLFVFFGMKTAVNFNNSIEFMDLTVKHKEFAIASLKSQNGLPSAFF
jgi:hypothetical protein